MSELVSIVGIVGIVAVVAIVFGRCFYARVGGTQINVGDSPAETPDEPSK